MTEPSIAFGTLVGLMVMGNGTTDTIDGIVRSVDADGEPERRWRVRRRGHLARTDNEDGTPQAIQGEPGSWWGFDTGEVVYMASNQHDQHAVIGGLDVGGYRPSFERWEGTDFTRPTGPIRPTTFLGRNAWLVELAPPSHKPHPLQLTVDAETGLIVRKTNEAFGMLSEWVSVDFDADLADDVFEWRGAAISQSVIRERAKADHDRDMAHRSEWLRSRGLSDVALTAHGELFVHEWDDATGSFYGSVNFHAHATLIRRAVSDEPWAEPGTVNAEHVYRWSDQHWEWFYAPSSPLTETELAELKAALARTR